MVNTIVVRYKFSGNTDDDKFQEWRKRMNATSSKAKGFIDRTELPVVLNETFYSVVLRFDMKENADKWLNSNERKELMNELDEFLEEKSEIIHEDTSFWFNVPKSKEPARWKQVIITFVAVYPLSIFMPYIVSLLFKQVPILPDFLISVVAGYLICVGMVYIMMPTVMKLFRNW